MDVISFAGKPGWRAFVNLGSIGSGGEEDGVCSEDGFEPGSVLSGLIVFIDLFTYSMCARCGIAAAPREGRT
jgi:hypothetical protein